MCTHPCDPIVPPRADACCVPLRGRRCTACFSVAWAWAGARAKARHWPMMQWRAHLARVPTCARRRPDPHRRRPRRRRNVSLLRCCLLSLHVTSMSEAFFLCLCEASSFWRRPRSFSQRPCPMQPRWSSTPSLCVSFWVQFSAPLFFAPFQQMPCKNFSCSQISFLICANPEVVADRAPSLRLGLRRHAGDTRPSLGGMRGLWPLCGETDEVAWAAT